MVRNFRFSMLALIVVTTLAACFLGAASFVGRQGGLDGSQISASLMQSLIYQGPVLLVWMIGLVLILQKSHLRPEVSRPAVIGIGGLLILLLTSALFRIWLEGYFSTLRGSGGVGPFLLIWSLVYSLLAAVCWVFVLRGLLVKIGSREVAVVSEDRS